MLLRLAFVVGALVLSHIGWRTLTRWMQRRYAPPISRGDWKPVNEWLAKRREETDVQKLKEKP